MKTWCSLIIKKNFFLKKKKNARGFRGQGAILESSEILPSRELFLEGFKNPLTYQKFTAASLVVADQSLSHVQLLCPHSLSFTISWSLLKLMSIESVMPSVSVVPFSSCPQSFPAPGSFPVSWVFASDGQSIVASASASVLPVSIQGWFPLGLTGLITLLSKALSRVFSSITIQKHQFFDTQSSLSHIHTWLLEKP